MMQVLMLSFQFDYDYSLFGLKAAQNSKQLRKYDEK